MLGNAVLEVVEGEEAVVGGGDLGIFLASWGTADPATDFNLDGVTNGIDLGILLSLF